MNILLDTNIILADPKLRSQLLDILLDYVDRTKSTIVLSKLVWEELENVYDRRLRELWNKLKDVHEKYSSLTADSVAPLAPPNFSEVVEKFRRGVLERMRVAEKDLLPYTEDDLRGAVMRALRRSAPCTDRGEEVRDAVLWQQVLRLASNGTRVVLISANVKEFAGADRSLRAELVAEIEAREIAVSYYADLNAFAKAHATRIAFVTSEWIQESIDADDLALAARRELDRFAARRRERLRFEERLGRRSVSELQSPEVDEFNVYEMLDGSIRLNCTFVATVVLEHEREDDWDPQEGPRYGGPDYREERTAAIYVEAEIVDEEVVHWDIYGIDDLG